MMKIQIITADILEDLKRRSRRQCEGMEDERARYRAEVGGENSDDIVRFLSQVDSSLRSLMRRFLSHSYEVRAGNGASLPDAYVYELELGERRLDGKAQPLADAIHEYIVEYTLAKHFANVSLGELSNIHSALTASAAEDITKMLHTKKAPLL